MLAHDLSVFREQRDLGGEAVGQRHRAARLPERLGAGIGVIMEDQEIADALDLEIGLAVVFGAVGAAAGMAGQQFEQARDRRLDQRSEEHTSELQSLMRISYAVFCLKKKYKPNNQTKTNNT